LSSWGRFVRRLLYMDCCKTLFVFYQEQLGIKKEGERKFGFKKNIDIFNIEARRPFRPERRGFYTPAEWTKINGITAIIADPHPEVLPLWCKINNPPAILVHIDDHADMSPGAPTLEQAKREYAYVNIKKYF